MIAEIQVRVRQYWNNLASVILKRSLSLSKEHWKAEKVKEKFTQLRSVMQQRSESKKYVRQVIINRIITLSICLVCALSLFYLYVVDITAPDGRDLRWV